jgi:hypothetical protein
MMARLNLISFAFDVVLITHIILVSSAQAFFLSAATLATYRRPRSSLFTTSCDANDLTALDIVITCMDGLSNNDTPWANAGLELCWEYSSDRNMAAQGGNLDKFITYASNPTFSAMVNAKEYSIENVGNLIPGTMTRGAMQTVLVKVQSLKGEERSFLW